QSPQRSASSDLSANGVGIIQRESNNQMRFHTWGNSGIVPYEGAGNQLSRNRQRPTSWGLQSWRAAMKQYVGLDVSLKLTAICIVDRTGKIEREGVVASDPETIAAFVKLHAPIRAFTRQGHLVGPAKDRGYQS